MSDSPILMKTMPVIDIINNNRSDTPAILDDEDSRLLESSAEEGWAPKQKEKMVPIPMQQAEKLVTYLNDAADLLTERLDELVYMEKHGKLPTFTDTHCVHFKRIAMKFISKFTGAKGISATVILQLLCLVMLTLVDTLPKGEDAKQKTAEFGSIAMLVLQTINLVIMIFVSVQLFNQIQKREVNRILLVQSYIATVLLFAGIYTASYRINGKAWKFISEPEDDDTNPTLVVSIYLRFFFFSISTATLCGAADALPKEWYTSLFVSTQMLLSFMYFASVLGTTLSKRRRPAKRKALYSELRRVTSLLNSTQEQYNSYGSMTAST